MDLFLFTNFFPCKKAEPFLTNEFEFTKGQFEQITILPVYGQLKDSILRPGTTLKLFTPLLETPSSKKQLFFKGLFNTAGFSFHLRDFLQQIIFLSPAKMYWFLVSLLITRLALSSRQYQQLVKQVEDSKNPVLYFYWGDNLCWIIPYLKRRLKNKQVKIIIRLHRTDLYENLKNNYAPLRKQIFALSDLLVPVSEDGESYLLQKYPFALNKLFLSRLGVFDNGLSPYKTQEVKHIVSVSALIKVKRVQLIFEALQHSTTKIVWHHFGDGPGSDVLKRLIPEKREGLDVLLHGFVDNKTLMNFYQSQSVDLFLNVSASEGLPVSIMEALSFGVPVIATRVGGTAELVTAKTGYILPADFDTAELGSLIDRTLNQSPEDTEELRKNARVVFEEKSSAEKNYNLFYKKIGSLSAGSI